MTSNMNDVQVCNELDDLYRVSTSIDAGIDMVQISNSCNILTYISWFHHEFIMHEIVEELVFKVQSS